MGGARLLRNELKKRLANDVLQSRDGARDFREGALGLSFVEAHADQGLEGLRTCIGNGGNDDAPVRRTVSMREVQLRGRRSRDEEPAPVDATVVRRAEGHEVIGVVLAAFGPK